MANWTVRKARPSTKYAPGFPPRPYLVYEKGDSYPFAGRDTRAAAQQLASAMNRLSSRGRLKPKRNGTTVIVVGGGHRRNPARDKRGRFTKRRR